MRIAFHWEGDTHTILLGFHTIMQWVIWSRACYFCSVRPNNAAAPTQTRRPNSHKPPPSNHCLF